MASDDGVVVIGASELAVSLQGIERLIANPKPLLTQVGALMKGQIARTFQGQRDPMTGAPWKPTSAFTLGNRPGGGGGGKTLQDTNALLNSLVAAIPKVTSDSVTITTNRVYANAQNFGAVIRPKNAKYLAIPLNRQAARAGSARRWWDQNKDKNPFIVRGDKGGAYIAYAKKYKRKDDKLIFMFRLLTSVTIPQRRFLGFGNSQVFEVTEFVMNRLDEEMKAPSNEPTPE